MYIERNVVPDFYGTKGFDDSDDDEKDAGGNYTVWVIRRDSNVVTPYTYDEAIGLTGHGAYSACLAIVGCISVLATSIDVFAFSTTLSHASCDLSLGPFEHNILFMMPYIGGMSTAYLWGYVADTRGRRLCLVTALWGSFVTHTLSAFSPNWVVLAVFKCIGFGFSNGVQSTVYTLVGECYPVHVKRAYIFLVSSAAHLAMPIYTALGYVFVNLSFSYELVFLTFTPWRLLILCLALPLGISAVSVHGLYESPKYLANVGEQARALDILRGIWRRNRCVGKKYPVEKLAVDEEGNAKARSTTLMKSMWEQTAPLFEAPLLKRTLQLYFLTVVRFSTINSLFSWFPFLANEFISGMTTHDVPEGMCRIIEHSQNMTDVADNHSCIPKSDSTIVWASLIYALAAIIINISILVVPNRKVLVISMLMIMSASSAGCALIADNTVSLVFFFTILLGVVTNGVLASYYVDLYPTSYRGMASCLATLAAQVSSLTSSILSGLFIMSSCTYTFYFFAAYIFCGMLVACFLPSDNNKKVSTQINKYS